MNPRVVTDEMGHSKTSITLDVYAHVFEGGRDEVRRTVDEYRRRHAEAQIAGR